LFGKILPARVRDMLNTVAVVLIEDFAPFEFGVLCEVFGMDRTDDGVPRIEFRVCAQRPGVPLATRVGLHVVPVLGLDALAGADLVALPAALIRADYPEPVLAALRAAAARGSTLLSVCSGAFILGAAGLLDGRRCTTHWRYADEFADRFPAARLDPDVLFVDDGDVITSAGTAAGIDACLHLVRRELGTATANAIARRMVVPPQRDGGQRQFVDLPIPGTADSLQPVLAWMVEHLRDDHTVAELARRAGLSERTFARRFVAETGTTPHRWLTMQRVLHARRLLEETRLGIDGIAQSAGFGTAALLRHHFHRIVGVAPHDYRRNFATRPTTTPKVRSA
jgi:transcriptional regulator GlxA family with amidase domain